MNVKTLLLVTAVTPLLLGCSTTKNDSSVSGQVSQMQPLSTVAASYRDPEGLKSNAVQIETENGLSGVFGNIDGTISEVQVRMNDNKTIAYVSIDGGEEVEFRNRIRFYDYSNRFGGYWYAEDGTRVYLHANGDSTGEINIYEIGTGTTARGKFGLETHPEDLPDSASYRGSFNTYGEIRANGQLAATVDFANGDIEGGMTGNAYNGTSYTGDNQAIYGTIDGSVTGSRIAGTVFVNGGATGELDFAGAANGAGAQGLDGAMAGTLTVGEEDYTTGGTFDLNRQSSISSH